MIFAAGLGTRLRPLTNTMPKALVNVGGRPMLEHVILKLKSSGFDDITINIHHFGDQILNFLNANNNFGLNIHISDERGQLLDTGGGIKNARTFLSKDNEPFLVHNVDILSNINLRELFLRHTNNANTATLLVSRRETSRYLVFNHDHKLCGWINKKTRETKPQGFIYNEQLEEIYAFCGIHIISPDIFRYMEEPCWGDKFSIIDFYTQLCSRVNIEGAVINNLKLIDIGRPETLAEAEEFLNSLKR